MNKRQAREIRSGIIQAKLDIEFADHIANVKDQEIARQLLKFYILTCSVLDSKLSKKAYERVIEREHQKIQSTIAEVKKFIQDHD